MDSKNNIILDNKTLKQALEKIKLMSDSMAMVLFVINEIINIFINKILINNYNNYLI